MRRNSSLATVAVLLTFECAFGQVAGSVAPDSRDRDLAVNAVVASTGATPYSAAAASVSQGAAGRPHSQGTTIGQKPPFGSWPFFTGAPQNFTSPAIGDLNGDHRAEVVFGSWDGKLYVTNPFGELEWKHYLSDDPDLPAYQPQLHSTATLADVDGNPATKEIIVGSGRGTAWGRLYVFRYDGVELARFNTPTQVKSSPLVIDADHDGRPEIYFGAQGPSQSIPIGPFPFFALNVGLIGSTITLTPRWTVNFPGGGSSSAPAAADLAEGPEDEIVVSETGVENTNLGGKTVYALRASNGSPVWSFSTTSFNNFNSPVLADLDGGGSIDVIQTSSDGTVYVLAGNTGSLKWSFHAGSGGMNSTSILHTPAVGDLEHDGKLEIVVGAYQGSAAPDSIYALNHDGTVRWTKQVPSGKFDFSSPTIADVTGDGWPDIAIGSSSFGTVGQAGLYLLDRFGTTLWHVPTPTIYSSISVADLDRDGELELCFGTYGGYYTCLRNDGAVMSGSFVSGHPLSEWTSLHSNVLNQRNQ